MTAMSAWEVGRVYEILGERVVCLRRYFNGPMEMVALAHEPRCQPGGVTPKDKAAAFIFERSGIDPAPYLCQCAIKPFVVCARYGLNITKPVITDTLGGVMAPSWCRHDRTVFRHILANAGPNCGSVCCTGCGAPVAEQLGFSLEPLTPTS